MRALYERMLAILLGKDHATGIGKIIEGLKTAFDVL
jgi:hypothetical protein